MHVNEMSESKGDFEAVRKSVRPCPKCGSDEHYYRVWVSHCGGYEDEEHVCHACHERWWVESADA